jgi:hypothetical protein
MPARKVAGQTAQAAPETPNPPHGSPGSGQIRLPAAAPREEAQHRRRWWLKAPPEATREDAMHPAFWAHVARWLSRHDVITLLAFDESWELELRVETVRQSGAEVSVSKNYARQPINLAGTPITDQYRSEYRAGEGWCVVRSHDGVAVVRGHTLEVSAINQFHREAQRAA